MADSSIPDGLRYTAEHEWVAPGNPARIGITDYAQSALGDVVYVSLPELGAVVTAGASIGEIESTKSVSELYAPVDGTVAGRNNALDTTPELINSDPYGEGWILEITATDPAAVTALLDSSAYEQLLS